MQYQYYSGSSWKDSNNGYSGFRRWLNEYNRSKTIQS
jgi:hypothetical protein